MRYVCTVFALALAACSPGERPPEPPITVFAAASLARPLATLADSFQRRENAQVLSELGGSMEQARKITDLGRVPDVLMLVDDDVVAGLMPAHIDWYVRFATNRLAVLYAPGSRYADSLTAENWWRILSRPGARVGRADPATAPVGRHALALLQRSGAYYDRPSLGDTLLARAARRFERPNATELAALLETGEVDFIIDYESVARQYGFGFVSLPEDLAPAVLYGLSVPRKATHPEQGAQFAAFVLSDEGRRILRDAKINVLQVPIALGGNVPPNIAQRVRTTDAAATAVPQR